MVDKKFINIIINRFNFINIHFNLIKLNIIIKKLPYVYQFHKNGSLPNILLIFNVVFLKYYEEQYFQVPLIL